ncbi:hypothetical protein XELAEV_18038328mg [Xenopus laevis]|uniref:Uncharacterized protein n=1 Tax=Xenopus laevis TaxID=8355 RepID=A0A974C5R6_XENLA|nr:hypothetical protein XELAEV_18038328mg [Xenopus laevis]
MQSTSKLMSLFLLILMGTELTQTYMDCPFPNCGSPISFSKLLHLLGSICLWLFVHLYRLFPNCIKCGYGYSMDTHDSCVSNPGFLPLLGVHFLWLYAWFSCPFPNCMK